MSKFFKRLSKTAGLAPGTLVHIGDKKKGGVRITDINYDETQVFEKELDPSQKIPAPERRESHG